METVDTVRSETVRTEDSLVLQSSSADPVIYQLVRVDGDGRLVPATDEEVMAVEGLIEDNRSESTIVRDTGKAPECNTRCAGGLEKNQIISSGSVQIPEAEKANVSSDPGVGSGKIGVQLEGKVLPVVPTDSDSRCGQSGSPDGCSKSSGGFDKNRSYPVIRASSKPNFSLLKGEICLDDLSVKQLQETFWATFGRETSVKDKLWLQKRIIMGLTNSCDFSTTTFVFTGDRLVPKGQGETCKSAGDGVLFDCVVESAHESLVRSSSFLAKQNIIYSDADDTKAISSTTVTENCGNKDAEIEQKPTKRARKPTRRYIEELSDGEVGDSVRKPSCDKPCAEVSVQPCPKLGLDVRCLTRKVSLGGSGVQVPYVSRIRRCRPRANFMNFMKLQPIGIGISTSPVPDEQLDDRRRDKIFTPSLSAKWIPELDLASAGMCKSYPESKNIQENRMLENRESSCKDDLDDEMIASPKAQGGMKRKHHRPWTLTEVVKLVEGVAKYGAGRWSEIKRVSFASYSYRTSVDLKDKWRNLLKASLVELESGNGVHCSRKPGSVPIPSKILSRVRELAHIQTQVPKVSSNKVPESTDSDRSVNETRPGFL